MLCQPRSLPLSPLAGRAFLPGVSAQEQKKGFVAGGRWCFWSPAPRKAEIISGCRGENRFIAVPSILHLSWGLSPPSPGFNQPWLHPQPRLWASPSPPVRIFSWSNTLKPQSRRIPLPRSARCLLPSVIGRRGVGRVAVGDTLGGWHWEGARRVLAARSCPCFLHPPCLAAFCSS